jgi:hypothetical protein
MRTEQMSFGELEGGDELQVDFSFDCWLTPGANTLTVAMQNPNGSGPDWLDDVVAFDVLDTRAASGVSNSRSEVTWRVSR